MTESDIQYYVQKRSEGWDNSQVRKELKNKFRFSDEDLFYWMNKIDDEFVSRLGPTENKLFSQKTKMHIFHYAGLAMMLAAVGLGIRLPSLDNLGSIKIIGGLFVGGYSSFISSRRIKRKLTSKSLTIKRGAEPSSILDLFTRKF